MGKNTFRSNLLHSAMFPLLSTGKVDYRSYANYVLANSGHPTDSAHKPESHVPGTTVSLLTNTSKMPSWSWSLPAGDTCPGSKQPVAPGSGGGIICQLCYAKGGAYAWGSVALAQWVRLVWTQTCLTTDTGRAEWIATMSAGIQRDGLRQERKYIREHRTLDGHTPGSCGHSTKYPLACTNGFVPVFRGHDSGDMYNSRYIRMWADVCRDNPATQFWFPTRSHLLAGLMPALLELGALDNVSLRPSAQRVGDPTPVIAGLAAGTGVTTDGTANCPAYTQGGACLDCRKCFTGVVPVDYPGHGKAQVRKLGFAEAAPVLAPVATFIPLANLTVAA